MRVPKKTKADKSYHRASVKTVVALPRSQVSEPTRSPWVLWCRAVRVIISEHNSEREAISALSQLRRDCKAGVYGERR